MMELKPREAMDPRWQWDLTPLYATAEAFEEAFASAEKEMMQAAAWQGRVAENPRQVMMDVSHLYEKLEQLMVYAGLHRDEDCGDSVRQALSARCDSLIVKTGSTLAFLNPELLAMPEETLRALATAPDFTNFSAALRTLLLEKPHLLPAEQEAMLAAAGEVLQTPHVVFSMFNDVDLPLPDVTMEDGQKHPLTHGNYSQLIRSQNRAVRKEAFEGMMDTYRRFGAMLSATYAGSIKCACYCAKMRKYDSARQASLSPLEIPESVYDQLLATVEEALPSLQEYLQLRKEKLGVDELHMYDLYVPIISDFEMKLPYPEAFELVCKALSPLGQDYVDILRSAYTDGWIDVYENKSKRSGAYSWSCYHGHPYVLLNHTDDLSGASTLAHELGHAMHSYYSNANQCYEKSSYSLFVAEVASTCNEVLLMRYLLKEYHNQPKAVAFLCNQLLEQFRTTVFRQTMFAAFEKETHAAYERGEALTREMFDSTYYQLNQKYYGGACTVDELIASEWMRIPHFYRDFYVYQYATGFSAAVAIANRILREGEPAVRDYKKFLSAGCSVPPVEALRYAGVDMEKPDAVREALSVFADAVKKLKTLLQA